jgi:hypothetical protein
LENYGGILSIDEKQIEIKGLENSINIQIDSFSIPLEYNFSIESLPIDSLLVNNQLIESNDSCDNKKNDILNCLQSKKLNLSLDRCTDKYNLILSYKVDDKSIYEMNDNKFTIREFKYNLNLKCKFLILILFLINIINLFCFI